MKRRRTYLEVLALSLTAMVTIATSKGGDSGNPLETPEVYGAASNCPDAILTNQLITVRGTAIISPPGATFLDFGLPVSQMSVAGHTSVNGSRGGVVRNCDFSKFTAGGQVVYQYNCYENAIAVCIVTFGTESN